MTNVIRRRRLSLAALVTAVALSPAMPAQASAGPIDCETRLERLEQRFREVEEKRGYEYATKWWEHRWAKYHKRCVLN